MLKFVAKVFVGTIVFAVTLYLANLLLFAGSLAVVGKALENHLPLGPKTIYPQNTQPLFASAPYQTLPNQQIQIPSIPSQRLNEEVTIYGRLRNSVVTRQAVPYQVASFTSSGVKILGGSTLSFDQWAGYKLTVPAYNTQIKIRLANSNAQWSDWYDLSTYVYKTPEPTEFRAFIFTVDLVEKPISSQKETNNHLSPPTPDREAARMLEDWRRKLAKQNEIRRKNDEVCNFWRNKVSESRTSYNLSMQNQACTRAAND